MFIKVQVSNIQKIMLDREKENDTICMKKEKQIGRNLTEGKLLPTLLCFSLPIILSNLIQQLYSMSDLIIVGKFLGSLGTVAVSTGGEMADLFLPIATAFASGGQIYIGQLVGAGNKKQCKETVHTLITLMMILAMISTIFIYIFHHQILSFVNCPMEAYTQATYYMMITTLGFPFLFGYNAICGILRGMGESKKPLQFILVAVSLNIVMDLLLVVVLQIGVAGSAIATVIAQIGSCSAAMLYLCRNKATFGFEFHLSTFRIQKIALKKILMLGIPQAVKSIFVRCSMLWVNANINRYGLSYAAVNSVGNKINKFLEVYVQGIDAATAAMVAQNLGARKYERTKRLILLSLSCCLCIASGCALLAVLCPNEIFRIFTSDVAVIEMGKVYMRIMILHFYMSAITSTFQALVTGSGFVSLSFFIGILDGVICRIGFSLLFVNLFHMEAEGYWLGTAFARTLPGLLCFLYFISNQWKKRKLLI